MMIDDDNEDEDDNDWQHGEDKLQLCPTIDKIWTRQSLITSTMYDRFPCVLHLWTLCFVKPLLIDESQCWFDSCFDDNCPRIWTFAEAAAAAAAAAAEWKKTFPMNFVDRQWLSRLPAVQKILAKLERVWVPI